MMQFKSMAFACRRIFWGMLLLGFSAGANALNVTVTNGSFSSIADAVTVDFGDSPINNAGPVFGSLPSGVLGGVTYSNGGGALFNFGGTSSPPNGLSAR